MREMIIGAALAVVIALSIFAVQGTFSGATVNGNAVVGDYQDIALSMGSEGYIIEPATLQKDVPVRMTADMGTLGGCMRDIRIPAFGVKKLVSEGNNVVTFTPDKAGIFDIHCSMRMGTGTFTVE